MNDLVRGGKRNPQSRSQGFGAVKRKHIIGAFSVELFSFYGINVREDQVDRFLSKVIKGSAGFNDVSEKGMIFFDLCLCFFCGIHLSSVRAIAAALLLTTVTHRSLGHTSSVRTNELVYDPIWIFISPEIIVWLFPIRSPIALNEIAGSDLKVASGEIFISYQ